VNGPARLNGQLRMKELKYEDQAGLLTCSSNDDNGRANFDASIGRINLCHKFNSAVANGIQKLAFFDEIGFLIDRDSKLISSTNHATDATKRVFINVIIKFYFI
jgi:hypothetical protein